LQCPQNRLDHATGIGRDIVVPKPENSPTSAFEPSRSPGIRGAVRVLAAVDFDHQSVFGARKVDNEISDRMLSTKFVW
jgi:hypothetical protein